MLSGTQDTYRVRIHYREPTYELYVGAKNRSYRWTYKTRADSPQQAKSRALHEFFRMAQISGVSWSRQVVLVELDGGALAV